jgi:hypothetical protein
MMPPKETRCAEGRGRPEEELREVAGVRTQSRVTLPANLAWVSEAARRDKSARFTALLHHVSVAALERAFRRIKRSAAPGVDGETVASYEENLAQNWGDCTSRFTRAAIARSPSGGSSYRRPMVGRGRSAYLRWKTKSSKARSPKC